MKKTVTLALLIAALMAVPRELCAQDENSKKEAKTQQKELQKNDKALEAQISEKAMKEARKKAKTYKKQGFSEAAGALPIDKQLEMSWKYIYDRDPQGQPVYLTATQTAVGGSLAAAKMQAMALAKVDLASQIETQVAGLIQSQVGNEEISPKEAETLVSTIAANKLKIQQTLGQTIPLLEISRTINGGKSCQIQVMIGYRAEDANKTAKKIIRESLQAKGDKLSQELDEMLK